MTFTDALAAIFNEVGLLFPVTVLVIALIGSIAVAVFYYRQYVKYRELYFDELRAMREFFTGQRGSPSVSASPSLSPSASQSPSASPSPSPSV